MRERKFRVLITDYIGYDSGVELPYLLTQADCVVDIFSASSSWLLKNKYWETWHPADTTNPELFGQELERIVIEGSYDWVVPVDDMVIRIMNDRITDEALFYKILPISKITERDFLGSKAALSVFATKYNILTPDYVIYDGSQDLKQVGEILGYPLIAKIDRSQGSDGVFKCDNETILCKTIEAIEPSLRKNMVFQKFIKAETLSCEVLYHNGFLLAYAPSTMDTVYDDAFGISVVRKYEPHTHLEPILVDIGEKLGANGFGNMTFMYDQQAQKYYFIELDLRPQVWFALDRFAGVDFSRAAHNFLINNYECIRPDMNEGQPIYIRHFIRDIMYSFKTGDIRNLFMWAFNLDGRWKFIPMHDPVFMLAVMQQVPITLIKKLFSFLPKRKKKETL